MILNNTVPIEAGETMYSYLLRLSYINGLTIHDFLRGVYSIKITDQVINSELDKGLYKLSAPLQYNLQQLLELVMRNTLFPTYSITHKPEQIAKYVNRAFRDFLESMKEENANHTVLTPNTTNFCPECIEESIKKTGFPIFLKEHQAPGVKKCYKHNVTLKKYTGERGREYEQYKTHNEDFNVTDDVYETKYAAYAAYLLNAELDISLVECEVLLKQLIMEKPTGVDYLRYQVRYCIDSFEKVVDTLLFLFDNIGELSSVLAEFKSDKTTKQKKHMPMILRCPVCGTEYITSADAIKMGWGCPNCDKQKTKEQIISKLIDTVGKGQYQLKRIIKGSTVEIMHKNCFWEGEDASIKLKYTDFIYGNKRCSCDTAKMRRWKEYYKAAAAYYDKQGDLLVPIYYVTEAGLRLGGWIQTQRMRKKRKTITQTEIEKLEAIGMIWEALDEQFEIFFKAAKEYYREHGDLLVPRDYVTGDGINLGQWINMQRGRKRKGKLLRDVVETLDSIGMVWEPIKERFEENYRLAKEYYSKYGNLLVPRGYITATGVRLGSWVNLQRQRKRKGKISQEEIRRLEAIGMVWNVLDEQFDTFFELAEEYYNTYGNLLVPKDYVTPTGVRLGGWVDSQRQKKKKGKISQEEIEKLETIGMVWDPYKARFEEHYRLAEEYYNTYGDLLVPNHYITATGIRLGFWIQSQRDRKKKGKISQEEIRRLEAIGMVWDVRKKAWEENYKLAEEYYNTYGNLLIPEKYITATGVRLGFWIREQRNRKDKGIMAPEEIAKLEAIGMVWKIRNRHK